MDRLKIALLTDMCGPVFGGGYQGTLWEVARRLARHHEVRVFTALAEEHLEKEGVAFTRSFPMGIYPDTTGTRGPLQPFLLPAMHLRDPLGEHDPDVLVIEAMPFSQLPFLGRWARRRRAFKLLNVDEAWVHYSPFPPPWTEPAARLVRFLLTRGLRSVDAALAVSPATAEALRGPYAAPDVIDFPSGIDVPRLSSQLPPGAPPRSYDVISVGRIVAMKRHRDLLSALALAKHVGGWAGRAVVLGEGPERPRLEEMSRRLGLSAQVEFLGRVSEARKMVLLATSKSLVLASEREGFSLVVLEAMLAGCVPLVAVPPNPEVFGVGGLVQEGETGRRFPLGDVAALSSTLQGLLRDDPGRQKLSEAGRVRAQAYDWDRLVARFEEELARRVATGRIRPGRG